MLASSIPTKIILPFANNAGGAYINVVPVASQIGITNGAASFYDGFPPNCFVALAAGGAGPFGKDFNGLLNVMSAWERWYCAGAAVAYDATFQTAIGGYPNGALVWSATTPFLQWLSLVDNNVTNPDTGGSGWLAYQPLVRGWKSGLAINTTLGNTTFGIAPGIIADSTNTVMISLVNGSFTKTTGAWVQGSGNGALDTGTIAASSSYALFTMLKPSTGAVDAILTKATAGVAPSPILPSGWAFAGRIGYVMTDAAAHIIPVSQRGNEVWYYNALPTLDFNGTTSTASRTLINLSVPLGGIFKAFMNVGLFQTGESANAVWLSDPATADVTPLNGASPLSMMELGVSVTGTQVSNAGRQDCWTNTAGQIGLRGYALYGSQPCLIQTIGWYDPFGSLN